MVMEGNKFIVNNDVLTSMISEAHISGDFDATKKTNLSSKIYLITLL
jgi:hypothetical protein